MFLEEQTIGAQVDKLLTTNNPCNYLSHIFVEQRFTAGYGNYRGATFIHRCKTLFHTESLVENLLWMLYLTATSTGEITAK
jgi:hypothetical protein